MLVQFLTSSLANTLFFGQASTGLLALRGHVFQIRRVHFPLSPGWLV